jgi:hypothetical protein
MREAASGAVGRKLTLDRDVTKPNGAHGDDRETIRMKVNPLYCREFAVMVLSREALGGRRYEAQIVLYPIRRAAAGQRPYTRQRDYAEWDE